VILTIISTLAPVNSEENARQVRADTAELATYGLTDGASSIPSGGGSPRSSHQIDEYFPRDDEDPEVPQTTADLRSEPIEELSEPVTPEEHYHMSPPYGSSGVSALTNMLRKSPPRNTSTEDEDAIESGSEEETGGTTRKPKRISESSHRAASTGPTTERTPLINKIHTHSSDRNSTNGRYHDVESNSLKAEPSFPQLRKALAWPRSHGPHVAYVISHPKTWDHKAIFHTTKVGLRILLAPVVLGCLLNVLDALSYGMILFPLNQPIFEDLAPAGIAMFYVSTIVSQVVYSGGCSTFKGGVGSEMIEVVPFFHKMAFTILAHTGENNPDAVRATMVVAMALSAMLTGIVFALMGIFNLGPIVGFIPRHILTGCIGGVGGFLLITGIEVTARLDSNLEFDSVLRKMFEADTIFLWTLPVALALFCFFVGKKINSNLWLPGFVLSIFGVFYFITFAIDELNLPDLRRTGWIFTGPETNEPWYQFYYLYSMFQTPEANYGDES
jgi:SulP family sulfate permease